MAEIPLVAWVGDPCDPRGVSSLRALYDTWSRTFSDGDREAFRDAVEMAYLRRVEALMAAKGYPARLTPIASVRLRLHDEP